jgi:hypothetical protein
MRSYLLAAVEKGKTRELGKEDTLPRIIWRPISAVIVSAPYESEYLRHCGTERRAQDDLCARIPAELR